MARQVGKVQEACAFLGDGMARIDDLEEVVHGRRRRLDDEQEMYFGVQVEEPMPWWYPQASLND